MLPVKDVSAPTVEPLWELSVNDQAQCKHNHRRGYLGELSRDIRPISDLVSTRAPLVLTMVWSVSTKGADVCSSRSWTRRCCELLLGSGVERSLGHGEILLRKYSGTAPILSVPPASRFDCLFHLTQPPTSEGYG